MALFTHSVTGDWNAGATWGNVGDVAGVDFPSEAGTDTFHSNSGVVLTLPSTYLLAHCSGDIDGELVIDGKLKLSGNLVINEDADGLSGTSGTIDVVTSDIVFDASSIDNSTTPVTLTGTPANRFTIMSSSTGGNIVYSGTRNQMYGDHQLENVDISGCIDITLAYKQTTGQNVTVKNCTFTGYDNLFLVVEGNLAANYDLDGLDFRDTAGATQRWSLGAFFGTDTGTRTIANITGSNAGHIRNMGLVTATHGTKITNLIMHNTEFLNATSGRIHVDGYYIDNIASGGQQDVALISYENGYYYSDLVNAHPFADSNMTSFQGNVIEVTAVGDGGDGILFGSAFVGTATIKNNIVLAGSDFTFINNIGASATGTINYYHNTNVVTTTATNNVTDNYPLMVKSQVIDWGGTLNIESNINHFRAGTGVTRSAGIMLANTTADQIDVADYNVFSTPDVANEYVNVNITGHTYPDAGFGGSDLVIDSKFVDDSRNIASWDASLGGPGTVTNAYTELLKYNSTSFNSDYTVSNLIAFIQAGLAPQEILLKDAGHDGVTPGAVEYVSPVSVSGRGFFTNFGQIGVR